MKPLASPKRELRDSTCLAVKRTEKSFISALQVTANPKLPRGNELYCYLKKGEI